MPDRHLIAEYAPPKAASFMLNFAGAVLLATAAFGLLRFFLKGNFMGAQWMFYPLLLAVTLMLSSVFGFLRHAPAISLYDNGVKVGGLSCHGRKWTR